MPYKDKEKERLRSLSRREYFRVYQLNNRGRWKRKKYHYPQKSRHIPNSMSYGGEMLGLKVLLGSEKINRPCDLTWKGKLVDVKTAKPTRVTGSKTNRWKFLLAKQVKVADLFLLIRKGIDDKVIDLYLIPNTGKKNFSFNEKTVSKYKQYLLTL
jgi:hypothetical protein